MPYFLNKKAQEIHIHTVYSPVHLWYTSHRTLTYHRQSPNEHKYSFGSLLCGIIYAYTKNPIDLCFEMENYMNFSKIKVKERLHAQASTTPKTKRKVGITIFKSLLVILVVGLIAGVCAGYGIFRSILDDAPDISLIDAVKPKGHYSTIYDANGNVMQKLVKEGTNREDVSYDQIPQNLVNAFIAIEDSRFREHNGVDIKGILRAAMVGITTGDFSEGGSTITQQLIKNNIFDGGLETNFARS